MYVSTSKKKNNVYKRVKYGFVFEPEWIIIIIKKKKSSSWSGNTDSQVKKKFCVQQSVKVMLTVFQSMIGSITIDFLEKKWNCVFYCQLCRQKSSYLLNDPCVCVCIYIRTHEGHSAFWSHYCYEKFHYDSKTAYFVLLKANIPCIMTTEFLITK